MSIDLIIRNIGQLVTLAGPNAARRGIEQSVLGIVANAAVAIGDGEIIATGPDADIMALARNAEYVRVLDVGGCLVTPGLVDAHTHLPFAGTREREFEMRSAGKSYAEILAAGGGIHATVEATRAASFDDLLAATRERLDRMVALGTTTVEAKSGYGLDLTTEMKQLDVLRALSASHPMDIVPTFMGAHCVPAGQTPEAYVDFVCNEVIPAIAQSYINAIRPPGPVPPGLGVTGPGPPAGRVAMGVRGPEPPVGRMALGVKGANPVFCDVFCETGAFTPEQSERILRTGQQYGMRSKIHADELCDSGGAALAARVGAISADHLHCACEAGLHAMADAGTIAVLLPGTAIFLGLSHHAPARRMIEMGIPVAVATDFNPGSCYSESLPLMMTFACTQLGMTPSEALTAVTVNAAWAIGMGEIVGSLDPGKQADLVIWNADTVQMLPYHMGANLAQTVIKRGQIIHGGTH